MKKPKNRQVEGLTKRGVAPWTTSPRVKQGSQWRKLAKFQARAGGDVARSLAI